MRGADAVEAAAATPPVRRTSRSASPFDSARRRALGVFVVPALAVYVLVVIAPTLLTVWISFHRWAGAGPMEYVGIGNYRFMLRDPAFHRSFVTTMVILFVVGAITFTVAFVLTMLLQDMAGRRFVRAVVFFPSLLPGLVIAILWGFLFDPQGLVNHILTLLGVDEPPLWLGADHLFSTVMAGKVWLSAGTYTVIFMAAADRIPRYFYEAADLDGASAVQRFRHVTVPLMSGVAGVCAVLWSISALKSFEFMLAFAGATGQLPPVSLWTFPLYSYATAFAADAAAGFGVASAAAVMTLALSLVLTILVRRVLAERTHVEY
ncbi:carbohydrate ABC transporter membrane protein 1 (CUT1 family) [Thermasporomyces composti]|uniref:Carbohydrate ABC transporter membrane protein 1 (CUT1 family) n=1 Tax=Thermasporomyces composti TaxID=696763 RepID=A0A3D9V8Y4_THECX|nr:carbohydrate ABC transporter membrane protein 1 (CUT1 family) [Thermasporomyces composti]